MAVVYDTLILNRFALSRVREVEVVGGGTEVVEPSPVNVEGGTEAVGRATNAVAAILVDAASSRALTVVGGGVTVADPAPVAVDGGAEAVSRATQASATTLLSAGATRTLSVVGGGVTVDDPTPVAVDGGAENIGRTTAATAQTAIVDVVSSRSLSIVGGGVTVDEPSPVTVQGGEEAVARSTSATATQPVTGTASRTLSIVGGGVTVSKASPVDVNGGAETVSRTTQSGSQVSITKTFFPNSTIRADSSGCNSGGFVCDSDSASDSDTDTTASSVAGKQATISFDVINCTSNASGDVIVRFLDGTGSELSSKTKSFNSADSGQTVLFNASAPSGTEQIQIDRNVSCQSFNDSGRIDCDSTCSRESVLVDENVTLTA
jgi:hypothetical protein